MAANITQQCLCRQLCLHADYTCHLYISGLPLGAQTSCDADDLHSAHRIIYTIRLCIYGVLVFEEQYLSFSIP